MEIAEKRWAAEDGVRLPDSLLLRGGEVAKALGVSRALAYRWMKTGVLPTVRVAGGKTVRVPRAALLNWIEKRTTGAAA